MTQTPTNTDLAAALREIADTLPLGSQLIVRLAADRLGEPVPVGDGWIEWSDGDCPVEGHLNVECMFDNGDGPECAAAVGWRWWYMEGGRNIARYRVVPD